MTGTDRIPVDQATRDRIRDEIARNMCVEAGAGTGKTTIMVARIVEIIRTGYAEIDELVIITFTEKAAAELATRVREALERALRSAEDELERERFDSALKGIYRARIETIHAFASSLLRERPVEAGLDPNFEVLDTLRADLGFDEQFRTWINDYLGGDEDSGHDTGPFRIALNRGLGISEFRTVCELVHERRYILPLNIPEVSDPDVFAFREYLRAEADELRALLPSAVAPGDKGVGEIQRVLDLAQRCERAGNDRQRLERVILAGAETSGTAGNNRNWDPPGHNADQKRIRKAINEELAQIQHELKSSALCAILPLAEEFTRTYEKARQRAGQAEFEDLLIWARDLLRDELHVRRDFQERFKCLLVDEFQDTDPLQVEIVMYLASDRQPEKDWTMLKPTPGKLFVVGDPKQSIYRFRRADISIYEQVKDEILPENVEIISQNFRSVPEVISWVNDVFSNLIQSQERIQPEYIELDPFLKSSGLETLPVVVVHSPEPATRADPVRQEEARLLAGTIRQAVEQEWPVRDESGGLRPARYGDVAILLPTRTNLSIYEDVFIAAGIPFRHEGGKEYFQRQEIRDLRACLRAVDNPGDALSIVTALRSGAFGCSDQQLFTWHQAHRESGFDYRDVDTDENDPVSVGLATLRRLHERRVTLSLPEIVEETIERTNLVEFALTRLSGGDQSAANLLKMVDQARAFSSASGGGLRAFVRWTITSSETRSDESDAAVAEATDDVVRLMTIHAAKGLEFPIVALANFNTSGGGRPGPKVVPNYPERRLAIQIGGSSGFVTPDFEVASEFEKQHEEAERLRLFYVAVTRAADYLVVPVAVQAEKASGMLGQLTPYLPPFEDSTRGMDVGDVHLLDPFQLPPTNVTPPGRAHPVTPDEVAESRQDREAWARQRDAVLLRGNTALRVVTASSQKDWDQAGTGETETAAPPVDAPVERNLALRIGNALHGAMEKIDLSRHGEMNETVAGLIRSALSDADVRPSDDHARDRVFKMVERSLGSGLVRRARSVSPGGELAQEVEFGYGLPDGGMIQGQMDLVFVENGEIIVGDFKSDNILPGTARERTESSYRGQAAVYAYAARAISGLPVREVIFYFAETDEEVSIPGHEIIDLGKDLAAGETRDLGADPALTG